jgi:hypothetical protein
MKQELILYVILFVPIGYKCCPQHLIRNNLLKSKPQGLILISVDIYAYARTKRDKEPMCPNHKVYFLGSGAYIVGCCAYICSVIQYLGYPDYPLHHSSYTSSIA